jgi:hypothetical protein
MEKCVRAIILRNLPSAVAKAVRDRARKEKLRLDEAIIKMLEEATEARPRKVLHHDLDPLAGTWSDTEYREFMEALREQR